jgi:hypothetical protein
MKKIHYIILVLIGFFLMPSSTLACGKTSNKSCCKTEMNSDTCKMKCCQKKSKDKPCDGKCGKSSCQIQIISFGAVIATFSEIKNNYFLVLTSKQVFYNAETNISSGFFYIWSPPNIG